MCGAFGDLKLHCEQLALAMLLGQHGIWIEEIHLTWPAVHEELNDTSGTRRIVGIARFVTRMTGR